MKKQPTGCFLLLHLGGLKILALTSEWMGVGAAEIAETVKSIKHISHYREKLLPKLDNLQLVPEKLLRMAPAKVFYVDRAEFRAEVKPNRDKDLKFSQACHFCP